MPSVDYKMPFATANFYKMPLAVLIFYKILPAAPIFYITLQRVSNCNKKSYKIMPLVNYKMPFGTEVIVEYAKEPQ